MAQGRQRTDPIGHGTQGGGAANSPMQSEINAKAELGICSV